jgi:hypothetical protein
MPVEFSQGTLLEMLLSACNVRACRNVSDDLLADPATREEPGLGLTEAPFQVGYGAGVGALSPEIVRILEIKLEVCSP